MSRTTKTDTVQFSPTDSEAVRESRFYPIFDDAYWTAAENHFNDTADALFNVQTALDSTRSQFFDAAEGVTADDVRRLELEVERAERLHEVAEESVAWLKRRRDTDARSIQRTGMPSGLAEKKNRLRRVNEQIAYAQSTERHQRLQGERNLTARRVAAIQSQYENSVRDLEDQIVRGSITQAQAQASADINAAKKNEAIAQEQASLKAVTDRYDNHLKKLNEERAELVAFLAEWDPAAKAPKLVRK